MKNKKLIIKIILGILLIFFIKNITTYAINSCNEGFIINNSYKTINCHGVCKKVKSNSSINYFVPTKTSNEWLQFRNNIGSKASLTNCVTYSYSWYTGSWSSCSASCGGGTQTRTVYCRRNDGAHVSDSYCSGSKPTTSQSCNTQSCCTTQNVNISKPSFSYCHGRNCGNWKDESSSTWRTHYNSDYGSYYGYTWHNTGFYQFVPITKTGVKYKLNFKTAYYGDYDGKDKINVGYYNSSFNYVGGYNSYTPNNPFRPSYTLKNGYIIMSSAPSSAKYIKIHINRNGGTYEDGNGIKVDDFYLSTYCY